MTSEVMARVETKTWVKALDRRALEAFVESVGTGVKKIKKIKKLGNKAWVKEGAGLLCTRSLVECVGIGGEHNKFCRYTGWEFW